MVLLGIFFWLTPDGRGGRSFASQNSTNNITTTASSQTDKECLFIVNETDLETRVKQGYSYCRA